jgi:hypothetical protein
MKKQFLCFLVALTSFSFALSAQASVLCLGNIDSEQVKLVKSAKGQLTGTSKDGLVFTALEFKQGNQGNGNYLELSVSGISKGKKVYMRTFAPSVLAFDGQDTEAHGIETNVGGQSIGLSCSTF